jgi:hypothetical protein
MAMFDGRISVEPAGNYAVEAKNNKGDVELTLPPNASASVSAKTRNGDIVSDYSMPSLGDGENKVATFQIGSGGAKVTLSTENGDVRIKKGSGFSTTTSTSSSDEAPKPPKAPNGPHLRAPKALPAQPVTQ